MIHLVLNSPYLGGAERSAIEQASMSFEVSQLVFHIPKITTSIEDTDVYKFLQKKIPQCHISEFPFQKQLFQVSRTHFLSQIFGLLFIPIVVMKIYFYRKRMNLSKADVLWLNGNKAAVLFLMSLLCGEMQAKLVWHWRDYPSTSGMISLVKVLLKILKPKRLLLLANSLSVEKSLKAWRPISSIATDYVYNPSGEINLKEFLKVETLGIASMLAPWKGHHDVLLNISTNKKELQDLGIKRCLIFGEEIYQTSGEHAGYKKQLEKLIRKLNIQDFVFLKGNAMPVDIYSQIDLLVHSSVKAEPFGRVLIESFLAGIPVLSTGLGGAGEVIGEHFERGWVYQIHHPQDFFKQISNIILAKNTPEKLGLAKKWSYSINGQIPGKLKEVFQN